MKTERQRMDLIYMNEQIILLNDSMPAGFFRCCAGEDRRLDIVNHELLSLFGCTDTKELEELTGGTLKGMLDVRDHARVLDEVLEQLHQGKEIIKAQFRIRSRNGGICWVDFRGRVVEDERGNNWVHAVMIDDTEAQNQKQEYWEKSMRDSLTGLFNRDAAVQSVNRYMQDGDKAPDGTLMVIDLDNFKEINDTKGHLFGDSVLTEAARCIAGVFDSQDMVGRIGGDEFLVFSKQLSGREEIMKRGRQLIEDIASLPSVKKSGSKLSCSIGAAVYPADGSTYEQLFLKADMALYAGKNWGKGRCVVYDPSLRPADSGKHALGRFTDGTMIDSENGRYFVANKVIHYVFKALYESTDLREAINTILKIIGLQFNVSRAYIFEDCLDGLAMDNTFEWCNEGIEPQKDKLQHMSYEWSAYGYRENFGEDGVFFCMDIDHLPRNQREVLEPQGVRSLLQCGIYDSGQMVGFVGFDECRENRQWSREQIEVLTYVARVIGIFLTKDRAHRILEQRLATLENVLEETSGKVRGSSKGAFDALTNLLTAGAFQEQTEQYLETGPAPYTTALFILDMDDFKRINEEKGKLFGNVVLMNVANSLKQACREGDLIARFGGDEFLVLLKNTNREDASAAGRTIQKEIGGILSDTGSKKERISCSMGVRLAGEGERNFSDIIVKANQALLQVKKSGKGGILFYEAVEDKDNGCISYDYLKQAREAKRREQSSLDDKTTTAVALEVFEKSATVDEAIHILMGFVGNRFRLNRIVLYMNGEGGHGKQSAYQWVDDRTALLYDPTDSFRREEFYIFYHLYDGNGIAVLRRREYESYNAGLKRILDRAGAHTMLSAGIFIEGRYSGMILLVNTETEREWSRAECEAVSEMARIVASGIKNTSMLIEAKQEAEYYRNHDALTGLMRYDRFKESCQMLMDEGKEEYVLVASDIKGFKFINEAIGYTQGDNILRMFGDMLTQNGLETNCYTRVSADQFLSFGVCGMDRNDFVNMVQGLNNEFCRMENEIYSNINLMIRSGIYFIEKDCREIETAVDRATIARKSVDYIIRSTSVVFNDGPFDSSYRENEIINRMEYALKHGEFKVYLQPKVGLDGLGIVGAEALVRWQHEDGRIVPPGDFIPLFEKNGFITQVDTYVFGTVCSQLSQWMEQGGEPLPISVNLSSVDIASEQLIPQILEITRACGLDHQYLEFELTETAFLSDSARTFHVMKTLQEEGFITSIDDFGSGYSIMNMMADIPTDVIKLDCGFVQSCTKTGRGREFLGQLIQMTNKMGFTSLCEGIETAQELKMLREMGCELGQGYYFSRPLPMNVFFEKFCRKVIDKS